MKTYEVRTRTTFEVSHIIAGYTEADVEKIAKEQADNLVASEVSSVHTEVLRLKEAA